MNEEAKYVPTKYDSVFWIDTDKIKPNPFQPRREFSEEGLKSLAESIRQYGLLQPLTVTRHDVEREGGGLSSEYELISGERRLRASKLIGLLQVPVVIRHGESDLTKLELAIIENLQREDLNAIDRAKALQQLIDEFGITQTAAAAKIGKSREYVANSLRLLSLPDHMQEAIVAREMHEGHARILLMLASRPEEQETLFREVTLKKLPVRAAERIARSIAQDRVRDYHKKTPEMSEMEKSLAETLGTRVIIEPGKEGGRLLIEFFSPEDLAALVAALASGQMPVSVPPASLQEEETPPMAVFPNTTQLESEGEGVESTENNSPQEDDPPYAIGEWSV